MQQLGLRSGIGSQRESETAFRLRQPTRALDQAHPARSKAHERPPGAALFGGGMLGQFGRHLQLAVEIVAHDSREKLGLVGGATPAGDVVHLGLGFAFREDRLLSPAPVVQRQGLACTQRRIGQDDLEFVAVFIGGKQLQLQRRLALLRLTGSNEDEAPRLTPAFRLPIALEEAHVTIGAVPGVTPLNLGLRLRHALESDRDRVLDAEGIQRANDLMREERAVHAHLENHVGQDFADFADAVEDEGAGALGVVEVAGTVPYIKHLAGLGHGAKQRVVAPLSLCFSYSSRPRCPRACAWCRAPSHGSPASDVPERTS